MNWYQKLSPSTQLLISGLLSILGAAITTTIAATYQNYTQSGQLNVGILINFALLTFIVCIGKALYDFVPPHATQLIQAYSDTQTQLHDSLARAQIAAQSKNVASAPSQSAMPAVIMQPARNLSLDDVQSLSAQLAINLMHMANNSQPQQEAPAPVQQEAPAPSVQQPFAVPARPVAPPVPVPDPNAYYDPMKGFSAVLPAYNPGIPDMATQSVPVA